MAAHLEEADFHDAHLGKADLRGAYLAETDLTSAFGDSETVLSAEIPRPAHWPPYQDVERRRLGDMLIGMLLPDSKP
jgi:hypothetical protein